MAEVEEDVGRKIPEVDGEEVEGEEVDEEEGVGVVVVDDVGIADEGLLVVGGAIIPVLSEPDSVPEVGEAPPEWRDKFGIASPFPRLP